MVEEVYNIRKDSVGNTHWTGTKTGEHVIHKGETNSSDAKILLDEIRTFIQGKYRPGYFVYPSVISRKFSISTRQACELLDMLCEEGKVERMYAIVCPICHRNVVITSDQDTGESVYCLECDCKIESSKNNAAIYKKL